MIELNWEQRLPASLDEKMKQIISAMMDELEIIKFVLQNSHWAGFSDEFRNSVGMLVITK